MSTTIDTSREVGASVPAGAPPKENLYRAAYETSAIAFRDDQPADGTLGTLSGHFAVFNEWTEINSAYEGHFLERIAPGAFTKTIAENRDSMRVLFQHGKDPQVGDKVLGAISRLEVDDVGAYYEVPLLDTSYNRDLVPGLKQGLYGASFRFQVVAEDFRRKPMKSAYNPRGLPERTVLETKVREFGPVTFGAYPAATAGMRSVTDEMLFRELAGDRDQLAALASRSGISLAGVTVPRFDNEDASCLAQMLVLATEYIDDQDETDDATDIAAMQGIVKTLSGLLNGEITEQEPDEPEDEMYSAEADGESRATWTTEYIDNLSDSAFLHVDGGGQKDADGKTTPRSLRHFPYKDASGAVDLPHLRNALARIPQSSLAQSLKDELTAKAQKILAAQTGRDAPEPPEATTQSEPEPSEATTRATPHEGIYPYGKEEPAWLL